MNIILGTDRIQLSKVLGQGGAATVFEHPHRELCVKIYKDHKEVEPARLTFLAAHPPAKLAQGKVPLWAWPEEIAYSELTGEACGYSMVRLRDMQSLSAVVNPNARRSHLGREFIWKVAIDVLKRIQGLHLMSPPHVMVDFNLDNFLVHRTGVVARIDVDSTHFAPGPGQTPFLSQRGRPEYQSPELVDACGPILDRDLDQDAFGAYCLVHRLIREGVHPFDAVYVGQGAPLRLPERIAQGIWPDSGRHLEYRPKDGAVPFRSLPDELKDLFHQMFTEGIRDRSRRPNVSDLLTALELHQPRGTMRASVPSRHWKPPTTCGSGWDWGRVAEVAKLKTVRVAAALTISALGAIGNLTALPETHPTDPTALATPGQSRPPQRPSAASDSASRPPRRRQPPAQRLPAPRLWTAAEGGLQ